jgi:hypothetical protein
MWIKTCGVFLFLAASCVNILAAADAFEGSWINKDKNTPDITKAEILAVNGRLVVRLWGNCKPEDCYWGEGVLVGSGTVRRVTWQFGYKIVTQELTLTGSHPPDLRLVMHEHFTDNSGRADYDLAQLMAKLLRQ